jgi:hypothetical protein
MVTTPHRCVPTRLHLHARAPTLHFLLLSPTLQLLVSIRIEIHIIAAPCGTNPEHAALHLLQVDRYNLFGR